MEASRRLDLTFAALADPTRRAILARLARGQASVAELARPFGISQPAISKHLKALERAQLISVVKDGQRRPRRIEARTLAQASAWLEPYRDLWEASFERLDALLEELQGQPGEVPQPAAPRRKKRSKAKQAQSSQSARRPRAPRSSRREP